MSKKVLKNLLVLVLAITLTSSALAQRQTGSLAGKVFDENNEPLPGVTVTLSGPALQGTQVFVTAETGAYRFPVLSPGANYSITCEIPGFNKLIQTGISISVGKTTTVNVTITQTTINEEVTVVVPTPAIDVKASKTSLTITKALLESIPMNREIWNILGASPSVNQYARFSAARGSDIFQSTHSLDGISMNDPATHYPLMTISPDIIEEIEIELGGHSAEVGGVPGSYINIVTSSGGNEFQGSANLFYFNENFVDKNFSKEQLDTFGIGEARSTDKSIIDAGLSLGGPIIKDKIWFFANGGYLNRTSTVLGFPEDVVKKERSAMFKLSFRLSKNLSLILYAHYWRNFNDKEGASRWVDPEAVYTRKEDVYTLNSRLNWIINQNAFLDFRILSINRIYPFTAADPSNTSHLIYDRGTGMTTGSAYFNDMNRRQRPLNVQVSLTLFKENFLGGNHELKVGAEYDKGHTTRGGWSEAPIDEYRWFGSPYYYGDNNGKFRAWGWGTEKGDGEDTDDTYKLGFYAQDSWDIGRFVFNIGVRYDNQHGNFPAQYSAETPYWIWLNPEFFSKRDYPEVKNIVAWNSFSPRLGLVFDLFGEGKTIAKASYGRYHTPLDTIYYEQVKPNRMENYIDYYWTDNNLNGIIDAADTFLETRRDGRGDWDPRENIDSDLNTPFTDEISIGIDHELLPNFKLGIGFTYKKTDGLVKSIERNRDQNWAKTFTVTDPGYDGVFETGDDQQLTVYDRTAPFVDYYTENLDEAWRKYQGLEFLFQKRMSNKWQLLGSITMAKSWGTARLTGDCTGYFETPNNLINAEGRLEYDRPLVIKMQGTYQLPYGINISGFFVGSSGAPFTREVDVYAPGANGYVRVMAEPRGARRAASWNRLDIRLEKEFAFGDFGRLGVYVDAYNALNVATLSTNTTTHGYIEEDGSFNVNSGWQTIGSTSTPRIFKLGLRFTF